MAMRVVILWEGTAMEAFKQVISFFMYFLINNGIYNEKVKEIRKKWSLSSNLKK